MTTEQICEDPFLVLALTKRYGCPTIIRELGDSNIAAMLRRTAALFPQRRPRVVRNRISTGGRPPRRTVQVSDEVIDISDDSDDEVKEVIAVEDTGDERPVRPTTQTKWHLPSSVRLDPYKYVTLIFWTSDLVTREIRMRTMALCLRWDGALVLFDHKVAIMQEILLCSQDTLSIRQNREWRKVSWHEPVFAASGSCVVFKTDGADSDLWDVDSVF